MATVYKARQLSLDRIVAIKILGKQWTQRPGFVEQFYKEGKAAAKLNHPHIVSALDVGQAGDFHYFVMEYVQGESVYERLMQIIRFDEEEALSILLQTAQGLNHAHEAGLVHRDVKPQNIMLTGNGSAKLADMGLAKDIADEPEQAQAGRVKQVLGSPYYISPDQILAGHDVDFRADIYSFGATIFFMLTGKVPFDAPTPQEVLTMHLKQPLPSAQSLNGRLSYEICQIIEVCMAKDREHRYDHTADLVDDLKALSHGESPLKAQLKLNWKIPTPPTTTTPTKTETDADTKPYYHEQRLIQERMFWPAVIGWAMVLILFILWALQ